VAVSHAGIAVDTVLSSVRYIGESGSTSAICTVLLPSPAHKCRLGVTSTPLGPGPFVVAVPPPLVKAPAIPPTRPTQKWFSASMMSTPAFERSAK